MLRPLGACMLTPPVLSAERLEHTRTRIAFLGGRDKDHLETTFLTSWIHEQKLDDYVVMYEIYYGGPTVLARHRGVVTIPYQVGSRRGRDSRESDTLTFNISITVLTGFCYENVRGAGCRSCVHHSERSLFREAAENVPPTSNAILL